MNQLDQKAEKEAEAKFNLGLTYSRGLVVEKDESKAVLWFWSAAEQNHAAARFHLGVMYE